MFILKAMCIFTATAYTLTEVAIHFVQSLFNLS